MLIDLSPLLSTEGKVLKLSVPIERDTVSAYGMTYPFVRKAPVELTLANTGKKQIRLEARLDVTIAMFCDRCLADVDKTFQIEILREFDLEKTDEERREELDEIAYLEGNALDVDSMVCEEVLVELPMKVLCKDDCKGICRKCGANLNDGACGCDTAELDPRMAKILDIFKSVKEV